MSSNGWQAVQWDSGGGDGLFITIRYHGKRFHVSLLPTTSPNTIEGPIISKYESMDDEGEAEEAIEAFQEEIQDIVYEAGRSIWTQLAPPLPDGPEPSDLHSLLYPETFYFRFVTNNGKAELIPHEMERAPYDVRFGMKIVNDMELPQYSSKDIRVLETIFGHSYIAQVSVEGKKMCCKSGDDASWRTMEREFNCLRKVARSHLADSIRVPRLLGLVTSAETGLFIGILEEHIPTGVLSDLRALKNEDVEASTDRRKKWGAQVRETIDQLHEIGVVWGDGKPHNVLIHRETDDAWVIDFGGSYTGGWVDAGLMETMEGDEQAVSRILKFLDI
ncbi:hypothetical protein ONS96_008116 [Cadophora gregata f. sp. sojae]|nr:hypothetical protein ONS96_008116 [Cadophora gregata f. sp. sojae]